MYSNFSVYVSKPITKWGTTEMPEVNSRKRIIKEILKK